MKEIGGYFELEYSNIKLGIHENAVALNTARNCLEYILLARNFRKLFIPYYTCDVLIEPLQKLNVEYIFYHIDEKLEPVSLPEIDDNTGFLYTNYFGVKGGYIKKLTKSTKNVIIDNSQALFEPFIQDTDTFYSLRKFTGVADGAFVYCNKRLDETFPSASSFDRVSHLYKRKDLDAASGYTDFKNNDRALSGLPIQSISPSTKQFILTYDFEKNKTIRERNLLFLHSRLAKINQFEIDLDTLTGPLCYPLLTKSTDLKEKLIQNKVFVPTYWPNVKEWVNGKNCFENILVDKLACLPIDHRYTISDLASICDIVLK